MKGKRHTTEEKIRALRAVDGGKAIRELCQEQNIGSSGRFVFLGEAVTGPPKLLHLE